MAAHQYWRLWITEGNSATAVDIAELQMRATSGGANQCSGGTASASDSNGSGTNADKAFDGTTTTSWQSHAFPTLPLWIKYAFAAPVTVTQVALTWGSFFAYAPKTFDIQYSDDNATWFTAWSSTGFVSPVTGTTYTSTEGTTVPVRVSAQSLEVVSAVSAPVTRVTAQSMEVLSAANPPARVTSQSLEVLTGTYQQRLVKSYALAVLGIGPGPALQKGYALAVLDDGSLAATDPYFSNVVLLLHANGSNASTTVTDSSPSAKTVTAQGNAQLSTAQFKYGTAALLLDGSGDYVDTPDSDDWSFGTGQFTVEMWVRFTTVNTQIGLVGQYESGGPAATASWLFSRNTSLEFRLISAGGVASTVTGAWTPVTGVWYHVAVDRDTSNVIRIYVNGVILGSATNAGDIRNIGTTPLRVGRSTGVGGTDLAGYMDDVRITKGIARYGGTFTPSLVQFPDVMPVGASLTAKWNVGTAVAQATDQRWNVRAAVGDILDLRANLRTGTGQQTDLRWDTVARDRSKVKPPGVLTALTTGQYANLKALYIWNELSGSVTANLVNGADQLNLGGGTVDDDAIGAYWQPHVPSGDGTQTGLSALTLGDLGFSATGAWTIYARVDTDNTNGAIYADPLDYRDLLNLWTVPLIGSGPAESLDFELALNQWETYDERGGVGAQFYDAPQAPGIETVVFSYDGATTLTLYRNGVFAKSNTLIGAVTLSLSSTLLIGNYFLGNSAWEGKIYEFGFLSGAWGAPEALAYDSDPVEMLTELPPSVYADLTAEWHVLTAIADSSDLRWNQTALAGAQADSRWNVRQPIQSTTSLPWNVAQSLGLPLDARWDLGTIVAAANTLPWNVRAQAGDTLDARWGDLVVIGDSLDARWADRIAAGGILDGQWDVRALAGGSLDGRWNSIAQVGRTLDARWTDLVVIGDSLEADWADRVLAGGAIEADWMVRAAIAADSRLDWSVLLATGGGLGLAWDVRALAGDAVTLRFRPALVTTPPPGVRTVHFLAELRTLILTADGRRLELLADQRTLAVAADARTLQLED